MLEHRTQAEVLREFFGGGYARERGAQFSEDFAEEPAFLHVSGGVAARCTAWTFGVQLPKQYGPEERSESWICTPHFP